MIVVVLMLVVSLLSPCFFGVLLLFSLVLALCRRDDLSVEECWRQ